MREARQPRERDAAMPDARHGKQPGQAEDECRRDHQEDTGSLSPRHVGSVTGRDGDDEQHQQNERPGELPRRTDQLNHRSSRTQPQDYGSREATVLGTEEQIRELGGRLGLAPGSERLTHERFEVSER